MDEEAKPESAPFHLPDPGTVSRTMADIAERSQRVVSEWLKRQSDQAPQLDPLNIGSAFLEMTARLIANPARLMQAQLGFWQDYMTLWQNTTRRMLGLDAKPVIEARPGDRRVQGGGRPGKQGVELIKPSHPPGGRHGAREGTPVGGVEPHSPPDGGCH